MTRADVTQVRDMRAEPVTYRCSEGPCRGTNLTYTVGGRRASSRVPWTVSGAPALIQERTRIQRLLEQRTGEQT